MALHRAPVPYFFNSNQGTLFTGLAYEQVLLTVSCCISRDGQHLFY